MTKNQQRSKEAEIRTDTLFANTMVVPIHAKNHTGALFHIGVI